MTQDVDLADLADLVARVDQLERDNRSLRAQLADASQISRRGLIGGAAAAAVGVVAGGLIAVQPAAAAPAPSVLAGGETDTVEETLIVSQQNSGDAFRVTTDGERAIVGVANPANEFGEGVTGIAALGAGVHGDGAGWVGVRGTGYYGVMAEGTTFDLTFNGVHPGAPNASTDSAWGDTFVQSSGGQATLWFCVQQSALPAASGRWVRLGAANSSGALTVLASPVRVYDSRPGELPTAVGSKTKLAGNVDRSVDCTANGSGVPADAVAVIINLTAVGQNLAGYMSTRGAGTAFAGTSNLNWDNPNQTVANSCTVACGAGATILVRVGAAPSLASDVVVDLVGYYR